MISVVPSNPSCSMILYSVSFWALGRRSGSRCARGLGQSVAVGLLCASHRKPFCSHGAERLPFCVAVLGGAVLLAHVVVLIPSDAAALQECCPGVYFCMREHLLCLLSCSRVRKHALQQLQSALGDALRKPGDTVSPRHTLWLFSVLQEAWCIPTSPSRRSSSASRRRRAARWILRAKAPCEHGFERPNARCAGPSAGGTQRGGGVSAAE